MKDLTIHISKRRQRCEIITFAVCFLIAFALNIYAIIAYEGQWTELATSFFYVLTAALLLYVIWTCVRLVLRAIFRKKRTTSKTQPL